MATNQSQVLNARPGAIWQPRTSLAWQVRPRTLLRAGFGVFGDLLPAGSLIDALAANPPFVNTFQGGLLGPAGGLAHRARRARIVRWMRRPRPIRRSSPGSATAQLSCASAHANPSACLPPVTAIALPPGGLAVPYYLQWSAGVERELPNRMTVRAQYVGTRGYDLTYQEHVNGYQTVCQGCFAPYPYMTPPDPRFGDVIQFMSNATSRYNGLQLTFQRRATAGLSWIVNYTLSHSQDEVSNGGFLPFSAGGLLSPLPGELARNCGDADYDVRHNLTATYTYELPLHASRPWLARAGERVAAVGDVLLAHRCALHGDERAVYGEWQGHHQRGRRAIREPRARRADVHDDADSRRHAGRPPSSTSIRTRSCPPSIPAPGPVTAATHRPRVSLAISDATPSAARSSSRATCT